MPRTTDQTSGKQKRASLMKTHVAQSDSIDEIDAAQEIIASCQQALGNQAPKAGILFASTDYEHSVLLSELRKQWPDMALVGGSTNGEFSTGLGFRHDSVVLTVFSGDDLRVFAGLGRNLSQDIPAAVAQATEGFTGFDPKLCVGVFAPTTNSSEVVRRLDDRIGDEVQTRCPIVGGLTGAPREAKNATFEFFGDEVLSDSLPLLFLSGDFEVGCGLGSGWFPIGEMHEVTKAEGHIVYEIDGKPAMELYREHYGVVPDQSLGEYPLALYGDDGTDEWALRAILDSEKESGLLRFAGEVLENARVRMTEVLPDGLLSGSSESLRRAVENFAGEAPDVALIFSCAARKWVLGTQAEKEIDQLRSCADELGLPNLQIAGFYAFGEISPGDSGSNQFHNETCVSIVLGQ